MPRPRGPRPRYRPEVQEGDENVENSAPPKSPGTGPYRCAVPTCAREFGRWSQLKRHERNHEGDKPNRCDKCPASFNVEYNLMLHRATHTTDKPECPDCRKTFSRIASLKAHIMLHEKEENVMCAECGDEFSLQSQLDKHMLEHQEEISGSSMYLCNLCNKEFPVHFLLKEHMKTHQKTSRPKVSGGQTQARRVVDRSLFHQECEFCMKSFKKPSQLVRHMRIHTGERPYKCEICTKAFNQKGSLQIHMSKHTGDKPHQCEFCPSVFSQKGNLRAHIARVHDLNKEVAMYPCDSCSCSYRKLGSLNSHITRVHGGLAGADKESEASAPLGTGGGGLQLEGTVLSSSVVSDVIQHLLEISEHSEEHSYAHQQIQQLAIGAAGGINSDILQQALENSGLSNDKQSGQEGPTEPAAAPAVAAPAPATSASRQEQVAAVAELLQKQKTLRLRRGRFHACKYCSKTFKKPSDLARHIRIHTRERPFKCTQCFRSFTVKSTMTAHLKTHTGVKEYKCHVCNKLFSTHGSLKVHLRLHTGAKPFDCPHCDKKFRTTGHRKTHITSHFKDNTLRKTKPNKPRHKPPRQEIELPDVQLQEPILITDTGLIQQLPRNSAMYNSEYINNGLQQGGSSIDRPYKCGYCAKSFKKSSHLKQHVRSHTGEKPFRCLQCGKSFVSTGVLKSHSRTHSGIKSYKCLICECTFTTNGSLKRHMSTHSEVRPFMCPYCQKTFKTSVNCKKHMKTHRRELGLQALEQVSGEVQEAEESEDPSQSQQMTAQPASQQSIVDQLAAVSAAQTQASLLGHLNNQTQEVLRQQASLDTANANLSTQALAQGTLTQSNLDALTAQETLSQATINSQNQAFMLTQQLANLVSSQPGLTQEQQISLQTQQIQQQLEAITGQSGGMFQPNVVVQQENIPTQTVNQRMRLLRAEMEDGKRTYRCGYCNKAFKKSCHLKQHIRSHTGEKPYACIQCGRSFVSSGVLKSHQRTHTGIKAFTCNICNTTFTTNGSLTRHMTIHSDVRPFDCPNCAESFRTAIHLKRHIRASHEETERGPNIDNRRTRNVMVFTEEETKELKKSVPPRNASVSEKVLIQEVLERDRVSEIHDKNELLEKGPKFANKCEHCPKSFKKPSDLVRHIRTHTGERPFKCDECGKTFTVKSTLECHMRTHRGGKSVTCHICRTVFATKGSLKVHMRLHTGSKPFKCPHCDERFRTSGSRKMHIMAHFKPVSVKKLSKAAQKSATTNAIQQFNIAESTNAPAAAAVSMDETEQNLLQQQQQALAGQPQVMPITIAGSDALTFGDSGMGATVLQGLEGLQLQLTATNLGQGLQLQGLEQSITVQIDPNLLQQLQHGSLNPIMLQAGDLNLGQIGLHLPQGDQVLATSAPEPTLPQASFPQTSDPQQQLLVRIDPSILQQVDNPAVVGNTPDSAQVALDANLITPAQQQELPIIPTSFSGGTSQPSTSQVLMTPNMSSVSVDQALNLSTVTSMAGSLPESLPQPVPQLAQSLPAPKQSQIPMADSTGALDQSVAPMTSMVTTQPSIIASQTDPIISEMLQTVQDDRSLSLGDTALAADPSGQQTFQLSLGGDSINLSQNIVLQPGIGAISGVTNPPSLSIGAITGVTNQPALSQAMQPGNSGNPQGLEVLKVNIFQNPEAETPSREDALEEDAHTSQSKQGTMSVTEAAASIGSLYTCNAQDCSMVFTSMNQLRKHQSETHGDLRPYVCSICNKAFKRHSHLKEHESTHLPKSPATRFPKAPPTLTCETCGKGFNKQSQLQRHIRIHTGERPFTCPQCDKGFNQKNSLQMHMMRHTGEKPHRCEYCNMAFSQRGNLRVHMIRTHNATNFDPGQAIATEMEDGEDMSRVMGSIPAVATSSPQETIDLESIVPNFFSE